MANSCTPTLLGSPQASLGGQLGCLIDEGAVGEQLAGALPSTMSGCSQYDIRMFLV